MNYVGMAALLGWLPLVVILFNTYPPKKLVPYLYVIAWLFLPEGGFGLPGLPDYTKMSATAFGILFSAALFDSGRLLALRPRWYDIPILAFCFGNTITTFANGLTAWDAMAATMGSMISWGLPYLVGRAYLTDLDAFTDLARAMVIGGLLYIPLCLFEIRFSPQLARLVFGVVNDWEGVRYGGYRPRVFLWHGLALGAWMMNASLVACVLWATGAIKSIRGISFKWLVLALLGTTVLCKSTGATILLLAGLGFYWVARQTKTSWIIWLAIAVSPVYCTVRTLDLWSGKEIVEFTSNNLGADRAESFDYRLGMERLLADRAMERPVLGWGGYNRFQVTDKNGKTVTVPDGFWIIALGTQGMVGLGSVLALFLLPMVQTLRRFPPKTWRDPRVAPAVAVGLMLTLMMVDCLSNAMLMPLYPFAIGGLMGCKSFVTEGGRDALEAAHGLAAAGRSDEAVRQYQRAIELASARGDLESATIRAEACDGIGRWHLASGRRREAAEFLHEALIIRDEIAAVSPDPEQFRDLAFARDAMARALTEMGDIDAAIEERRIALEIWDALESAQPDNVDYRDGRADALNDLSWLLTTSPGSAGRDPALGLALAEEAIRIAPGHAASWNTLGVARYRAGDWAGAVEALERSTTSGLEPGGTAFDHYFLAMAWCKLHRDDTAAEWLVLADRWTNRNRPGHPDLARFRKEAESVMRVEAAERQA